MPRADHRWAPCDTRARTDAHQGRRPDDGVDITAGCVVPDLADVPSAFRILTECEFSDTVLHSV